MSLKEEVSKIVHAFEGDLKKLETELHELIDRHHADNTEAVSEAPAASDEEPKPDAPETGSDTPTT